MAKGKAKKKIEVGDVVYGDRGIATPEQEAEFKDAHIEPGMEIDREDP